MDTILNGFLFLAMLGVVGVLVFGIVNLYRTDGKARSRSNKLMRLRVLVQFIAVLVIVAILLVRENIGG